MKKATAIVLIMGMLLAFTACGKSGDNPLGGLGFPTGEQATEDTTQVTFVTESTKETEMTEIAQATTTDRQSITSTGGRADKTTKGASQQSATQTPVKTNTKKTVKSTVKTAAKTTIKSAAKKPTVKTTTTTSASTAAATIKTLAKTTAKAPVANRYYNVGNNYYTAGEVTVRPYEVYWSGNDLVAKCYVINGCSQSITNINVVKLALYNTSGQKIVDATFNNVLKNSSNQPWTVRSKYNITCTFTFKNASTAAAKPDLTKLDPFGRAYITYTKL